MTKQNRPKRVDYQLEVPDFGKHPRYRPEVHQKV